MGTDDLDLLKFIEKHAKRLYEDKMRTGCLQECGVQLGDSDNENTRETTTEVQKGQSVSDEEIYKISISDQKNDQNFPLVEPLDLSSCNGSLAKDKQAFIDILSNAEIPLTFRSNDGVVSHTMLRYGEFSPNNPQLRVAAAPYIGLGEYDQRRALISKQRQADYKEHILKKNDLKQRKSNKCFEEGVPLIEGSITCDKAVQTDICNIHNKIVQYELHSQNPPEKELSPQPVSADSSKMHSNRSPILSRAEHRFCSSQGATVRPETSKPKSILSSRKTEAPRDYHYSYVPSILDGFNYEDRADFLERERLKRETYQAELRQQIEEKKRLSALRNEQERRERDVENRRFEQQMLKMQEEQYREEQYRVHKNQMFRRTSDDLKLYRDEQMERAYRKHADSESSATSLRNTKVASKPLSHYSPPVSRRVPYSFNNPSTSTYANPPNRYNSAYYDSYKKDSFTRRNFFTRSESMTRDEPRIRSNSFNRYESLSRIDSLQRQESLDHLDSLSIKDSLSRVPRRHSATQQDLSLMRRSPKSQRSDRSSCSRLDDTLPIPVLKAHSPVAKDLKNSIAVDSSKRSTDYVRKLEDRWQVPAVQRNIITHGDGPGRSILTQLGAIRLQLQKEQLRMDETLRKRGISQPKAV
ncbi:hypothetical protein FQA39_LY10486 [Lamprigera yunnana]|nr:hypothetical protein FQA39_LY10486 [Lamprigera yunnana]